MASWSRGHSPQLSRARLRSGPFRTHLRPSLPMPASPELSILPPLPYWAGLKKRLALAATFPDSRPEDITEEELERIQELKAAVLQAQGLGSPPEDWLGFYYHESTLLRFFRAKGSIEIAKEALLKTMHWASTTLLETLQKYEGEDHHQHKALMRRYIPEGQFGVDRRGAPVTYVRLGLRDTAGLIREVGLEEVQRYMINQINVDSLAFCVANMETMPDKAWMGGLFVVDLQGISLSRGAATVEMLIWLAENVLTPNFPEITYLSFLVNVPWFFSMGWAIISPFIPARTKAKFRIYSTNFMEQLQEHVAPEQIPAFLGGSAVEPWPYGEGGEVPEGAGKIENKPRRLSRRPSWVGAAMSAAGKVMQNQHEQRGHTGLFHHEHGKADPKLWASSEATSAVWKVGAVLFICYTLHMLMRLSGMLSACARFVVLLAFIACVQVLRLTRTVEPPRPSAATANALGGKPVPTMAASEQPSGVQAAGRESSLPMLHRTTAGATSASTDAASSPRAADLQAEGLLEALFELPGHLGEFQPTWAGCVNFWAENRGACFRLARSSPESGFKSDLPYRRAPLSAESTPSPSGEPKGK